MADRKYAKITLNCRTCATEFRVYPYNTKRQYCSKPCQYGFAGHIGVISLEDRFWSKVNKDGSVHYEDIGNCWIWTSPPGKGGYGEIGEKRDDGKWVTRTAHTVSYRINVGPIQRGKFILHKCDIRMCVRPSHLYMGVSRDNSRDMVERGRHSSQTNPSLRRGENHPKTKLTWNQVDSIREKFNTGVTQTEISREYGITQAAAHNIVRYKTWVSR